jgi:WD40 repeat protein
MISMISITALTLTFKVISMGNDPMPTSVIRFGIAGVQNSDFTSVVSEGKVMVTLSWNDVTLRGWDIDTTKEIWKLTFPNKILMRKLTGDYIYIENHPSFTDAIALEKSIVNIKDGTLISTPKEMTKPRTVTLKRDIEDMEALYGKEMAKKEPLTYQAKFQDAIVGMSPDQKTMITLDKEKNTLKLYDWPTGDLQRILILNTPEKMQVNNVQNIVYSPDLSKLHMLIGYSRLIPNPGKQIVDNLTRYEVWDLKTTKQIKEHYSSYVAFVNIGNQAFLVEDSKVVTDIFQGKQISKLENPSYSFGWSSSYLISPDGKSLTFHSYDVTRKKQSIEEFDVQTGKKKLQREFDENNELFFIAMSYLPDGRLVTVGKNGGTIWPLSK